MDFFFCSRWVTRVRAWGPAPTIAISTSGGNADGLRDDRMGVESFMNGLLEKE
jgi:hypothetical protein